eukprot:c52880_g1_i1.p2 GENE.c52880_g1_i1~~c52880_g1_i1.p2  ORF type:complete len:121 (-),score=12.89 c52880_g1_i1:396-758(-)
MSGTLIIRKDYLEGCLLRASGAPLLESEDPSAESEWLLCVRSSQHPSMIPYYALTLAVRGGFFALHAPVPADDQVAWCRFSSRQPIEVAEALLDKLLVKMNDPSFTPSSDVRPQDACTVA